MQVAEIRECCASARKLFADCDSPGALQILDKVIGETKGPAAKLHPLTAVCYALKAEILQASGSNSGDVCVREALKLCDIFLQDDFENVAPVLLNLVRYFLTAENKEKAADTARKLIAGCDEYYGSVHPRSFQLRRWLEEAGCPLT